MDTGTRADAALRAAEAGAELAAESFRGELVVETKSQKTDVVTQADRDAQTRVTEALREAFPGEPIVGEEDETPNTVPDDGPGWIVDPIDGTTNFVRGIQVWTTSVAATIDGEPVAGATVCPSLGDTFVLDSGTAFRNGERISVSDRTDPEAFLVVPTLWWEFDRREEYAATCRGIVECFGDMRRFGSAQTELALCANGAVDAVVTNVRGHPWDTVTGVGLIEAAGGTVTDVHGEPWRHDSRGLVASNGAAHDVVVDAVSQAETVAR
ncbi:MAG: inositol monophosphatase [Natronomonas sp.]|uniref:inositol monophosphatase family protein n=1 Tax=Natronomonas sp. TaxID=2184060 RepID=UPI00286FFEA8|nr:inositol monophosphatase [Natronomonas sp.]MDR9431503.1 inositol monophosphatase [Natronomonas sp.]